MHEDREYLTTACWANNLLEAARVLLVRCCPPSPATRLAHTKRSCMQSSHRLTCGSHRPTQQCKLYIRMASDGPVGCMALHGPCNCIRCTCCNALQRGKLAHSSAFAATAHRGPDAMQLRAMRDSSKAVVCRLHHALLAALKRAGLRPEERAVTQQSRGSFRHHSHVEWLHHGDTARFLLSQQQSQPRHTSNGANIEEHVLVRTCADQQGI